MFYLLFLCSVFSVDCSTVECPPVKPVQCPADSYETQVRLTADGCCTLPTRLDVTPISQSRHVLYSAQVWPYVCLTFRYGFVTPISYSQG